MSHTRILTLGARGEVRKYCRDVSFWYLPDRDHLDLGERRDIDDRNGIRVRVRDIKELAVWREGQPIRYDPDTDPTQVLEVR